MIRRVLTMVLALAWCAALVSPAAAQFVIMGPGGVINHTGASVSLTNSTTATSLYSFTIPGGLTQQNFAPLHLKLLGTVSTNPAAGSVGTMNIGCNWGGTTASISLVNAVSFTANLSNAPLTLDLYLTGYSTTQSNGVTDSLQGRFGVVQAAGTETVYAAQVQGTTSLSTNNALACTAQWASASTTNTLLITSGQLMVGE